MTHPDATNPDDAVKLAAGSALKKKTVVALARLLAFAGWDVTREYYINDGGAQVDVLARSAYERYREANGLEPEIREGLYPGDYLIPVESNYPPAGEN